MDWKSEFDKRELQEIHFCLLYRQEYDHGTSGHLLRTIIAKMARLLDKTEKIVNAWQQAAEQGRF